MIAGLDPRILVQLVLSDRRVHELQMAVRSGQRRENDLGAELTQARGEAGETQRRLEELATEIRKNEREIEEFRRQSKVHGSRLNEIQDTREYRALNEEIRYLQRQVSEREELILGLMEQQEKLSGEFDQTKSELSDRSSEISEEKTRIESERLEQTELLNKAIEEREKFLASMPEAAKNYYDRRSKRIEMPIVWLRDAACGYCMHRLTPQKAIEVRDGKSLVECESCGRLIVNVDNHDVHSSAENN